MSIQQLVEQTLAPEVREKRCEECGCETATTTTQLTTMPKVMLLYLKRYKYLGTMGGGTVTTTSRKVTRLVDIFDNLSLEKVVSSDVSVPEPVLSDPLTINSMDNDLDSDQVVSSVNSTQSPPSTPVKNNAIALPFQGVGTPIKFKGKTEEELSKLSEEEQTEYLIYISQKESMTSAGREDLVVGDEDEDLKAALEASLLDVTTTADNVDSIDHGTRSPLEFKTPPRKRHQSVTSSDSSSPPSKVARHSGGVFSRSTDTLVRRGATPTPDKMITPDDTPASTSPAPSSSPEKKQSWKKNYHRPETKAEEDADFERALELSTQDLSSGDDGDNNSDACVPESSDQRDHDQDEEMSGPAELCYKLSSIVSHFGASTAAGHYVADVYRWV